MRNVQILYLSAFRRSFGGNRFVNSHRNCRLGILCRIYVSIIMTEPFTKDQPCFKTRLFPWSLGWSFVRVLLQRCFWSRFQCVLFFCTTVYLFIVLPCLQFATLTFHITVRLFLFIKYLLVHSQCIFDSLDVN